jgi:hypothetical protein
MEKHVKPVGIWIRVSTEDQAHGESPEQHEKRALAITPNPKIGKLKRSTTSKQ